MGIDRSPPEAAHLRHPHPALFILSYPEHP
jgi:hypothetical protein